MIKSFYIYDTKQKNYRVTQNYVSIIRKAVEETGFECIDKDKLEISFKQKSTGIVAIDTFHVIKAKICRYGPIVFWVQGAVPEESFYRRRSKIRKAILTLFERVALNCSDVVIYVSEGMRKHYLDKYGFVAKNYYVMPCFSTDFPKQTFEKQTKENIFLYAGSISAWQCFEETVQLYKKIEDKYSDVSFLIMTNQKEQARAILERYAIHNYEIGFADGKEYYKIINKCKFGFCLRKDDIVNYISTPTKFSDYIGHGIIPIYTKNTRDFYLRAAENPFCLCANDSDFWNRMDKLLQTDISMGELHESYRFTFGNYYSKEYHVKNMREMLLKAGIRNDD